MQDHIKCFHKQEEKTHKCDRCEKTYCYAFRLRDHIAQAHEGVKYYECPMCEKAYNSHTNLKVHIRKVHQGIMDFKCSICEKEFGRACELRRHTKTGMNWVYAKG